MAVEKKTNDAKSRYKRNQLIFIWGGLAIPLISWIVFYWYVNFSSFVQAFQNRLGEWSFENFVTVYDSIVNPGNDRGSLATAFSNTWKYFVLEIVVKYPIQLIVCYFLYKQVKGYKFFRYVLYLPAVISGVALTGLFKEFIAPGGPLELLGVDVPLQGFLGSPLTATPTIMVYTVWVCVCGHMLLLCGAMNRIPVDVLEAARLDGIGPARELLSLILPMIWPTLSTLLILTCTGFLNSSGPILLLAPDTYTLSTTTINYWIFEKVYANGTHMGGQYNLVSAAGMVLTVVTVPIILALRKLLDLIPSVEY